MTRTIPEAPGAQKSRRPGRCGRCGERIRNCSCLPLPPLISAPTPSASDVESLIEALQPILAKCEQYDRKENAWSKRYSEGFTVGISLGTCRRIRAAITSHDTEAAILLRRYRQALETLHDELLYAPELRDVIDAALKEGAEKKEQQP